ncbi:DoxX family protein [Arcanobacterium pinnipediorum]|uniref:DoxX family membrane protein n=1 Tax=Arcanobacterium pinnipediorum TaxID=1503041 RepID=A0ABY5AGC3_9ACTO|nr:hypothetical protein [Arcanobacterium pinnipediorum]USR79117.1 hypothetical protein NG665_06950 [Arcanobacterium pinnipediorum]
MSLWKKKNSKRALPQQSVPKSNATRLVDASRTVTRIGLGTFMSVAGISHLTTAREEFQAQVPHWVPLDTDFVVVSSGVVEIGLGLSMLLLPKQKFWTGTALALFYVAIFPGNISQYANSIDAFGLDTDAKRLTRLFFQPVLIGLSLWSAGLPALKNRTTGTNRS